MKGHVHELSWKGFQFHLSVSVIYNVHRSAPPSWPSGKLKMKYTSDKFITVWYWTVSWFYSHSDKLKKKQFPNKIFLTARSFRLLLLSYSFFLFSLLNSNSKWNSVQHIIQNYLFLFKCRYFRCLYYKQITLINN